MTLIRNKITVLVSLSIRFCVKHVCWLLGRSIKLPDPSFRNYMIIFSLIMRTNPKLRGTLMEVLKIVKTKAI